MPILNLFASVQTRRGSQTCLERMKCLVILSGPGLRKTIFTREMLGKDTAYIIFGQRYINIIRASDRCSDMFIGLRGMVRPWQQRVGHSNARANHPVFFVHHTRACIRLRHLEMNSLQCKSAHNVVITSGSAVCTLCVSRCVYVNKTAGASKFFPHPKTLAASQQASGRLCYVL